MKNRAKKYGISIAELKAMQKLQDYECKICRQRPNGRALAIDHVHITGFVRGLLCTKCNMGLGYFISPTLLRKAARYLENASKKYTKQVKRERT